MRTPPPAKKKRNEFSDQVKLFIEALIANSNVTRAYKLAYPKATAASACASGHRLLRNALVQRAVNLGRKSRLERYGMDADEAMKRIALIARADIRQMFDDEGRMRPVQEWPDELALAVRGIEEKELGTKVTFDSRLAALELIASAGGKVPKSGAASAGLLALLLDHAKPEDRVRAKEEFAASPFN
jgi:phage terminase small subunit